MVDCKMIGMILSFLKKNGDSDTLTIQSMLSTTNVDPRDTQPAGLPEQPGCRK